VNEEQMKLLDLVKDVPLVRHMVMEYFQGFKNDNREVIEDVLQNVKAEGSENAPGEK
jgi:hypothetical protein